MNTECSMEFKFPVVLGCCIVFLISLLENNFATNASYSFLSQEKDDAQAKYWQGLRCFLYSLA